MPPPRFVEDALAAFPLFRTDTGDGRRVREVRGWGLIWDVVCDVVGGAGEDGEGKLHCERVAAVWKRAQRDSYALWWDLKRELAGVGWIIVMSRY